MDSFCELRNELTNVLKLATNLETLLCNTMNWLIRHLGYCNIAIGLADDDDSIILGAYMKHTIKRDYVPIEDLFSKLYNNHVKEEEVFEADFCNPQIVKDWGRKYKILKDHKLKAIRCDYLGVMLAAVVIIKKADQEDESLSDFHSQILEVFSPVFAVALACIMSKTNDSEDDSQSNVSAKEDWWKRGEEPPF